MAAVDSNSPRRHVGKAIADALEAHDVTRAFLIPGESFLPVLDGLYDSSVDTVVCRHEGGAAYMAEAHGKLTGQPGVAMVTRGPGAANAFVGIHTAWQDATPLVLFVGLIPFADRDRESFQEFDPKAWFGSQTKQVFVLDDPSRASQVVAEAFFQAASGRPGPVIVGLPEDILHQEFHGDDFAPIPITEGAVANSQLSALRNALNQSQRPLLFVGGPRWTSEASLLLNDFATNNALPVIQDWRAADRIPFDSPANAGWLGYGRRDQAAQLLDDADLVIAIGAVLGDVPTDGYTLRQNHDARTIFANIDPGLRGNSVTVTDHILASPTAMCRALSTLTLEPQSVEARRSYFEAARVGEQKFAQPQTTTLRETPTGTVHLEVVFKQLQKLAPNNAVYTFGAGNHCIWAQQYARTLQFPSQLSVRNGSMGYSIPAAVATALECPERLAIAIAGDGEFGMNGQELATALQENVGFIAIVISNGEFGTIRDHQENHFPERVSGTQLANPDFGAVAQGYGAYGETVTSDDEVKAALERTIAAATNDNRPALLNFVISQEHSLPEFKETA